MTRPRTTPDSPATLRPEMPETAACSSCGYLLRGLIEATCPECGREFDPAEAETYVADPAKYKRRKWVKRGVLAVGLGISIFLLAPRGLVKSNLTMTCSVCGHQLTHDRWELLSPEWVQIRYPGYTRSTDSKTRVADVQEGSESPSETGELDASPIVCAEHCYLAKITVGKRFGGTSDAIAGNVPEFNYMQVHPHTAKSILKKISNPATPGIRVGTVPKGTPQRTPAEIEVLERKARVEMDAYVARIRKQQAGSKPPGK